MSRHRFEIPEGAGHAVPLHGGHRLGVSSFLFQKPAVSGTSFIHPAPPSVVKWIARLRAGCLATRARLLAQERVSSAACLCCASPLEDDEHVLLGCSVTGTEDYMALFREAWAAAAAETKVTAADPLMAWLEEHRWQLVAALIPASISGIAGLSPGDRICFARRLHLKLAHQTAERLRRRQILIAAAREPSTGTTL